MSACVEWQVIVGVYMYMCSDCGCVHVWSGRRLWVCTCVEWQGIVGVYMCGVSWNCGCVYMCGVERDCGCVHVWSGKGLWVCTCVEWKEIVGVYMCGVARDCGCVHVSVERELKRLGIICKVTHSTWVQGHLHTYTQGP